MPMTSAEMQRKLDEMNDINGGMPMTTHIRDMERFIGSQTHAFVLIRDGIVCEFAVDFGDQETAERITNTIRDGATVKHMTIADAKKLELSKPLR
jgi:hypothetical protein